MTRRAGLPVLAAAAMVVALLLVSALQGAPSATGATVGPHAAVAKRVPKRCAKGNSRTARRCRCLRRARTAAQRRRCPKPRSHRPVLPAPGTSTATTTATAPATTEPAPASTAPTPTTTTETTPTGDPPPATTPPATTPPPVVVGISLREYSVVLSRLQVAAGSVRFDVANWGEDPHDVHVRQGADGADVAATPEIPPADGSRPGTARTTATLAAGIYTLYCALPAHDGLGMHATLTVE